MHIQLVDTAIIIVNWSGRHLLKECLQSLDKQTYKNFKIILVDNGSTDNSVEFVREKFPEVEIIELKENTGFAKGNNIGISKALEDKNIKNIILLNNDTKAEKDFVEKLVRANNDNELNKKYKKIGALAPKMLLLRQDNSSKIIDAIGARTSLDGRGYNIGNGEIDKGQYDKSQEVFSFCGGAVLLKREMLEDTTMNQDLKTKGLQPKTGPSWAEKPKDKIVIRYQEYFDDDFFAYYEDSDLSWRMRLRGWQAITIPEAVVWHLHSATAEPFSFFKAYYLNRNRFLMMLKDYPWTFLWQGLLRVPASYFKFIQTEKGRRYIKGDKQDVNFKKQLFRKIKMFWVMIKVVFNILVNGVGIIQQRKLIQKNKIIKKSELKKWLI